MDLRDRRVNAEDIKPEVLSEPSLALMGSARPPSPGLALIAVTSTPWHEGFRGERARLSCGACCAPGNGCSTNGVPGPLVPLLLLWIKVAVLTGGCAVQTLVGGGGSVERVREVEGVG